MQGRAAASKDRGREARYARSFAGRGDDPGRERSSGYSPPRHQGLSRTFRRGYDEPADEPLWDGHFPDVGGYQERW